MSDSQPANPPGLQDAAKPLPSVSDHHDPSRSAKHIIDQAIYDNRISEYILYSFAVTFVVVGVFILCFGLYSQQPVVALTGAVASGLFIPSMSAARQIRKESIAIRLLEAPLQRADTAKEASDTIRELVTRILTDRSGG